jgi:hypothetical protein
MIVPFEDVEDFVIGTTWPAFTNHRSADLQKEMYTAPKMDMVLHVVTVQMNGDRAFDSIERMTIYVSPHDQAIGLSEWIFGGGLRVGDMSVADVNPVQKRNTALRKDHFNLIVAKITDSGVGHSYYRLNPGVESDLIQLLRYGVAPGAPGRPLKPLMPGAWMLDDQYPRSP